MMGTLFSQRESDGICIRSSPHLSSWHLPVRFLLSDLSVRPMILRRGLSLLLVAGLLAGCVNMSSTLTIRPDGSGTITERVMMGSQLASMLRGMGQMGDSTDAKSSGELFTREEIRSRADSLSGLRLESMEMISSSEEEGYEAVYAFDNLNEVQLDPSPDDVMPDRTSQDGDGGGPSDLLSKVDMSFTPGTPATLTITMPRDTAGGDGMDEDPFSMDTPGEGPPSDQEMRMMREMMRNSGFRLAVTIDGEIVETNATHRSGSTITLVEMDFEPLVQDSAAFRKVMVGDQESGSPEAAIDSLNALPGFTIEPQRMVTVRFQ